MPAGEYQSNFSVMVEEATKLVDIAKERDIPLRIFGATAIVYHCPVNSHLFTVLGRRPGDIDYVSYIKYASKIAQLMEGIGYEEDRTVTAFGGGRMVFRHEKDEKHCDVFLGKLEMSHTLSFEGRLEFDYPTVPLADLFLAKMQIFKLNEKDIIDTIVLLREHELAAGDRETINTDYVTKLCAKDWGLWRTVTGNLRKVAALLPGYSALPDSDKTDVSKKVEQLASTLESAPKSLSWKIRARVGESRPWYNEVEDLFR